MIAAVVAVCAALAVLAAGCGARQNAPDLVNGKQLFATKATCGSCHTLARANTHGTQGPNLDDSFAAARSSGLGTDAIAGIVRSQIADPRRGGLMPANLVTGDDARDVAAYVATVAGVPGQDTGQLAQAGRAPVSNVPIQEQNGTLTIPADPSGALSFTSTKAQGKPGQINFVMPNPSPIPHSIAITGNGANGSGAIVSMNGVSSFSANLQPGTYSFYCTVPGHAEAGMKGDLTVAP